MNASPRPLTPPLETGHERWFAAARERLLALPHDKDPGVRDFFAPHVPVLAARAPGRLDVMGGIADYSGATVLELPLDCATTVLQQRQVARRCDLATRRGATWQLFSVDLDSLLTGELSEPAALGAWIRGREPDRWPAYLLGVVQWCAHHFPGYRVGPLPGIRLLVDSTVPEGAGVASSAALEVAAMTVALGSSGDTLPGEELAAACQWVENHVVGAPCGIMDQMTSALGQTDTLLRLTCRPVTLEGYSAVPAGYRFYGIDSGVRHAVTGADYETVRTAAFMGYRIIAAAVGLAAAPDGHRVRITDPVWHGYLANITPTEFTARFARRLPERMSGAEFLARYGGTTDRVTTVRPDRSYPVRQATAHPIFEQARVVRFAHLLEQSPGDEAVAEELGALMRESHASYSACGLGSDATDRLVALVAAAGPAQGLYGAKITGGGSGGTVAILGAEAALPDVRRVAEAYGAETGRAAAVFSDSGPGALETGARRVA